MDGIRTAMPFQDENAREKFKDFLSIRKIPDSDFLRLYLKKKKKRQGKKTTNDLLNKKRKKIQF